MAGGGGGDCGDCGDGAAASGVAHCMVTATRLFNGSIRGSPTALCAHSLVHEQLHVVLRLAAAVEEICEALRKEGAVAEPLQSRYRAVNGLSW